MLAWRGRGREALLAALRQGGGGPGKGPQTGHAAAAPARDGTAVAAEAESASATRAVLADVTGPALGHATADFWSPGLSPARLRALAVPPAATAVPDLLLRMSDPPPVTVRGADLRDVLAPAYEQLAADQDA
jgi:hypothetical protein